MKKSTVIRSDKPHAVKMTEGSNVAQRKSSAKKTEKLTEEEAPVNIQKVAPVRTTKTKRLLTTETPDKPVKAAKAARAKPQVKAPIAVPRPKSSTAKTDANPKISKPKRKPVVAKPSTPELVEIPLWEQDNPIKARIEQLKATNAQLSEQLQRLPSSRSARGLKP